MIKWGIFNRKEEGALNKSGTSSIRIKTPAVAAGAVEREVN